MGVGIWASAQPLERFTKPIDFCGEPAFLFHRTHRLCRFIQAFAQANMMKRLTCEKGSPWMPIQDVAKLPGLCKDRFARATQLNDLYALALVEVYDSPTNAGRRGLWEYENVKVSNLGLEAVNILKHEGNDGLIVIYGALRQRCLPFTNPTGWP